MSENVRLLDMFPPHTYEEWRQAVDVQLKGAPFEKVLVKKTYEDIGIQPSYFQRDVEKLPHMGALPGFAPFVRGTKALGSVVDPRLVSQEICYGDPVEFNRAAKMDIEGGQNALNVLLDKATLSGLNPGQAKSGDVGRGGLSLAAVDDAAIAFDGIDLEQIPIHLQAGASGLAVVALIASFMRKQGKSTEKLRGCIAVDPFGTLSLEGTLPLSLESAYQEMAQLTAWAKDNAPELRTIAIHGHPYHNSGGSAVQELAFTVATGVEYIREMLSRGLSIDDVAQRIGFALSVGSDFFMEIAKLRAARLVWEKIIDTFGGNDDSKRTYIHARTSSWNKTVTDPYVNMLRVSTETFSAICGGCDSMHVGPFDEAIGLPDDFSRRIARNVQVVLKDECHFDQVVDPAGGSWYVEAITDAIARKAWQLFQEIEKKGGMFKALQEGFPQKQLSETAAKRAKGIATRKDVFIGTNKYPNLLEKPVNTVQPDYDALYKERSDQVAQYQSIVDSDKLKEAIDKMSQSADDITGKVVEEAIDAAMVGASLNELTKTLRSKDRVV